MPNIFSINHWALLCRKSAIDNETNHVMIGEVIEDINFQVPEQIIGKLFEDLQTNGHVVLPFEGELLALLETEHPKEVLHLEMSMLLPNEKSIVLGEVDVKSGDNGKVRNRTKFNALPIGGNGRHTVILSMKNSNNVTQIA